MADNPDADIDEIIGQEDLELDELDKAEPELKEEGKNEPVESGKELEEEKTPSETGEEPSPEEPVSDPSEEKADEQPETPEAPAPLTKEDMQAAIREMRDSERNSSREIDSLTDEVIKKYYPEGLSNVLIDEKSGKELRTPQDVIDASGGELSYEDAWRWLNSEQQKLDKQVEGIKDQARNLAETNANFSTGIDRVLQKYKPVFEAFKERGIQEKVYKAFMNQVKMDEGKELVLSAPDVEEFYDLVMEPYLLAYGNMQTAKAGQGGQPPTPAAPETAPKIPDSKPSIEDRLDESGDSGGKRDNEADPNDANDSLNKLFGE